jgi:hypothetical protein
MSLVTMQTMDGVRFLDDLDVTLALDNRQTADHQMTNLEITMQPVILRASLVDINLITSIIMCAVNLYSDQNKSITPPAADIPTRPSRPSTQSPSQTRHSPRHARARSSLDKPLVHLSKEKVYLYSSRTIDSRSIESMFVVESHF